MANHDSVAVGQSLTKAMENALLVEWLAALLLRVAQVTDPTPSQRRSSTRSSCKPSR
jgi:L-fuculose-phosphate aldolase